MTEDPPDVPAVTLSIPAAGNAAPETVDLLDGGGQAYPRMLEAIAAARDAIHLEVYAFAPTGVGQRFVEALGHAARRGVKVRVLIDGWGSARGGRQVAAALDASGCSVKVHNRLLAALIGRIGRNHRKILLVDDEVAYLGGINIGDENVADGSGPGWADVALEIRGAQCRRLGQMLRRQPRQPVDTSLRIFLCGLGGGWRLRRRYLDAFHGARLSIHVAHGYFLPDKGIVRAIVAAARRGVEVRLLLAGRSDVPFARAASRSLYRQLLLAGVRIHEWNESVLHAKIATIDGCRLLVGSFNLDPFSLANLETLVDVEDPRVVAQAEAWISDHFDACRVMTSIEQDSWIRRWLLDPFGRLVAKLADATSRVIASRHRRGLGSRRSIASHRSQIDCRVHPMVNTRSQMLELGTPLPEFTLADPYGNEHTPATLAQDAKGTLIVFMCNHCPFVKHVRGELAKLGRDCREQGVAMFGINSNDGDAYPDDSPARMKDESDTVGYVFPYLVDAEQSVAKLFRAACTPDFFLFDGDGKLVYRGRLDDSRPSNGVAVTGKDLRAAIEAVVAGEGVAEDQVPSIGCNIKWKPDNEPAWFG